MKNKGKAVLRLGVFSLCALAIGLLGTLTLYRFFPQYLCHTIQDAHESDLYERWEQQLLGAFRYTEHFTPTGGYLRGIIIHLGKYAEGEASVVAGTLQDGNGRVIARSSIRISDGDIRVFREFPIEKWVNVGQEYQFIMDFPADEGISVTMGYEDARMEEHKGAESDMAEGESVLYIQYVYGSYSRKLLLAWFMAFSASACLIGEAVTIHGFAVHSNIMHCIP